MKKSDQKLNVEGRATGQSPSDIADLLRTEILTGRYQLGERIKLGELAARFGTSVMPVREALRILDSERLIRIVPNRGAEIRRADGRSIAHLYGVRMTLEAYLAELATQNLTLNAYDSLAEIQETVRAAVRSDDHDALLRRNNRLHDAISELADNPEAARILREGNSAITLLRNHIGFGVGRLDQIVDEHDRLLEAIFNRDATRAGRLAWLHAAGARDDMLSCLKENEE